MVSAVPAVVFDHAVAFALLAVCESLQSIRIRLPRPRLFLTRAPVWSMDGMTCLLMLRGLQEATFADETTLPPHYLSDRSGDDAALVRQLLTRTRKSDQEQCILDWPDYSALIDSSLR